MRGFGGKGGDLLEVTGRRCGGGEWKVCVHLCTESALLGHVGVGTQGVEVAPGLEPGLVTTGSVCEQWWPHGSYQGSGCCGPQPEKPRQKDTVMTGNWGALLCPC